MAKQGKVMSDLREGKVSFEQIEVSVEEERPLLEWLIGICAGDVDKINRGARLVIAYRAAVAKRKQAEALAAVAQHLRITGSNNPQLLAKLAEQIESITLDGEQPLERIRREARLEEARWWVSRQNSSYQVDWHERIAQLEKELKDA